MTDESLRLNRETTAENDMESELDKTIEECRNGKDKARKGRR